MGALVVGCDLSVDAAQATVELVRGSGGDTVSKHPCHLTDPADCRGLIDLALDSFGRVDVVFYLTRAAWPDPKAAAASRWASRPSRR